jgi:hypothetical protein
LSNNYVYIILYYLRILQYSFKTIKKNFTLNTPYLLQCSVLAPLPAAMLRVGALSWVWRLCSLLYFILRKSSRHADGRSADNQSFPLPFSSESAAQTRAQRRRWAQRPCHARRGKCAGGAGQQRQPQGPRRRPIADLREIRERATGTRRRRQAKGLCAEPADAEWLARSATARTNQETIRSSERAGRSLFVLWSRRPCLNRFSFLFSSFSLVK